MALKLPYWLLIVLAGSVAVADYLWERRHPTPEKQPQIPAWPWQTAAFWIVLALLCGLGVALAFAGAPPSIVALVCGTGLAFYAYHVASRVRLKRITRQGHYNDYSGLKEWTLFGISVGFCVLSLLLLRNDWRLATGTLAFFGVCAFVFLAVIFRRRRERRWTRATVRVTGGVNIHVSGSRFAGIALTCCLLGAIMSFVEIDAPIVLRLIGAFIGLIGVILSVALTLGFHRRQFIRFDPDGFVVGTRAYEARIDWNNIAAVSTLEYARNPFVGVALANIESVRVEPATKIEAFLSSVRSARALFDTDLSILSGNFGIESVVLAGALHRYATQPDARQELVPRAKLPRIKS